MTVKTTWRSFLRTNYVCMVYHAIARTGYQLHTNTHTHFTTLFPGLPRWDGNRKVKPIWILLKQETVSGSGISWAICKSAPHCREITPPAPHYSVLLQVRCPSCCPTNNVKALKAHTSYIQREHESHYNQLFCLLCWNVASQVLTTLQLMTWHCNRNIIWHHTHNAWQ